MDDDFDKLFDHIERMMRESFGHEKSYKTSYDIPIDVISTDKYLYLTFESSIEPELIVNKDSIEIMGDNKYRTFKLPCTIIPKTLKKTYVESTGIVDVRLKKEIDKDG